MKSLLLAAIFALPIIIHPPAEAASNDPAGIVCRSTGVADAGYNLYIRGERDSAVLSEVTFAGFGQRMDMNCTALPILAVEGRTQNTLLCINADGRVGSSTKVRLYENRMKKIVYASVRTQVVVPNAPEEEVQFGRLACEYTVNKGRE